MLALRLLAVTPGGAVARARPAGTFVPECALLFFGGSHARATGSTDTYRSPAGVAATVEFSCVDVVVSVGGHRGRRSLHRVLCWRDAGEHARSGSHAADCTWAVRQGSCPIQPKRGGPCGRPYRFQPFLGVIPCRCCATSTWTCTCGTRARPPTRWGRGRDKAGTFSPSARRSGVPPARPRTYRRSRRRTRHGSR